MILITARICGNTESRHRKSCGVGKKYVDVTVANEEDCQKSLGIHVDVDVESETGYRQI